MVGSGCAHRLALPSNAALERLSSQCEKYAVFVLRTRIDGVASREAHHGRAMPGEFLVFFDRSWPQSDPVWVPRIVREQQPRTQPTSGRLDHHGSVAG